MVAELITQCPKCQTSFKVKEAQLKVANGLVRCGSCLHVFNAVEFSALDDNAPVPPKLQQADQTPMDDLFEQDTLSNLNKNVDLTDDSVNEFISKDTSIQNTDDEELLDLSSEMLNDDEEIDADELFGGATVDDYDQDESWAEQMLEELASSSDNEAKEEAELQSSTTSNTDSSAHIESNAHDQTHNTDHSSLDNPPHFESEPVYLNTAPTTEKTNNYAAIGWATGCLLACLFIMLQIAWLNFSSWSKLPELRSGYAIGCAILDCKLPNIQALNKVRASNLIVRSDNDVKDQLIIDAILTNQAAFTQPYPKLALIFTDGSGNPVASGLIYPNQYLGGELAGAINMEKNIPVHIAFKIKDPGANARSYRLEFYP